MAIRTTKASSSTAVASPNPIILIMDSLSPMNPANTAIMISAAATTTRALCRNPDVTAWSGVSPWTYASRIRETRKTS